MKNRKIIFTKLLFTPGFLALFSIAEAVSPPPDGGYANFNTAEGQNALFNLTTGQWNTSLGGFTLWSNTDGSFNTAVGTAALLLNVGNQANFQGIENTAVGAAALLSNTTGSNNAAVGANALLHNDSGFNNTAVGWKALSHNDIGSNNCAFGSGALYLNTSGLYNTAVGTSALFNNTGSDNTAVGSGALDANGDGIQNTAVGSSALAQNTSNFNTAVGFQALAVNNTGGTNTAVGVGALVHNTAGSNNIALGYGAGSNVVTASGTICIAIPGVDVSDGCYIGHVFEEALDPDHLDMAIDVNGKVGTPTSSRRFKDDIKPMDKTSEAILALRPVTFHYKNDTKCISRFGLIAEEVAEVSPDLVAFDKQGKPFTVRYDQVNAMLLNEFLKEHHKMQELEKGMAALTAEIKEQATQIQKVSAQLEMNQRVKTLVLNNQ
jgi:hypothetical protein